ncbi:MAG: AIPR family protein [Synergistaceae bacterium]|nr:AIPR family protein [Synergistaceae bacterium]
MEIYERIKHDIAQEYYTDNYPNDGQRFIAWYLRNIHGLDSLEAKSCITDGAGDKQIDAVYVNHQDETVYIIQGKFYSSGKVDSSPLMEVLASWIQIKDLMHLQENANEKLKAKISEISSAIDDDYRICFELITASELTESAKADAERFTAELSGNSALTANLVIVDKDNLEARYNEALNSNRPYINHVFSLEESKYMDIDICGTRAVIAAIPLRDCVSIPGIRDGSLFRKNVRQSLGSGNRVNKDIARTLRNNPEEFFFLHNGITAICSSLEINENHMTVKDLNVVNGCQSLTTILNSSEAVKHADEAYIMFRFYEITDNVRADTISISTNSQSAVKARDLRSNDKYVLAMKKAYEHFFTDGYFITKRGEKADTVRYNTAHTVDLTSLGKQLIAWHSQRPTISYSESKIFDKYFEQLFHREYSPENIDALSEIYRTVFENWKPENSNPIGLNETLLAMKAYAPYHHFFAVSVIFCEINNMPDSVPDPHEALKLMKSSGLTGTIIDIAGQCLNMAFELAASEASQNNKVFSPPNWIKAKASLKDIRGAVKQYIMMSKLTQAGRQVTEQLTSSLKMSRDNFSPRWAAD